MILGLLAVLLLAWVYWPTGQAQQSFTLEKTQHLANLPDSLIGRVVQLTYPKTLRIGEQSLVALEILDSTNQASASLGKPVDGSVEALSRLDLPGITFLPEDLSSTALLPGQVARFQWTIYPGRAGEYTGQAWFYIKYYPGTGGEVTQDTISAQPFRVQVLNTYGLSLQLLKVLAWSGVVLGTFITLGMLTFVRGR